MGANGRLRALLAEPPVEAAGWNGRLEDLLRWLLEAPAQPAGPGSPRSARLRELLRELQGHPQAAAWNAGLREALAHASAVRLLAETGIPGQPGVLGEALDRLVNRVVPRMDAEEDLFALLDRLELDPEDADWLEALEPAERDALTAFLPAAGASLEALHLLALRVSGLGLSRELLRLAGHDRDLDSPFARLPEAARQLDAAAGRAAWDALLQELRHFLALAHDGMEAHGVSADLVYRLELLEAQLARMERLGRLLAGAPEGAALAVELLRGAASQRRLGPVLRAGAHRLARKVVEHTGRTGEQYLAQTGGEYRTLLIAALGGGAITAGTALVKILLGGVPLAPGPLGLAFAFNYTASFVLMQFLHFPLASKQPAMTAAALAAALEREDGLAAEVDLAAAIVRGQVAATLGNLLAALPVAFAVDAVVVAVTGHNLAGDEKAVKLIAELHPFLSWTLPFAVLTGLFLWLASLASGWAANWSAYRGLPGAVGRSPLLLRTLGPFRTGQLSGLLEAHFPGILGYLVLGLLLGFMPRLLAFAGLPLDVRHVTLSAASLGFGASRLLWTGAWDWAAFAWGLAGVGLIGLCNFSVSFALSLRLAVQARGLDGRAQRRLLAALGKAVLASPGRFLWSTPISPPAQEPGPTRPAG
jgi:site-specific recombinase